MATSATSIQPSERPIQAVAAGPPGTPVVIGVDLGTTSAKIIAVDADLRLWASTAHAYALHSPRAGWAEQDPAEVTSAALRGLRDVQAAVAVNGGVVAGVSVSAAMHSILAVDEQGHPLTPALTYADGRAAELAAGFRTSIEGAPLYHRTGVPHHPMAPLFKIAWFAKHDPEIFRRADRWVSLKEHLLTQLGGPAVVDYSIASGTGLFDLREQRWDPQALAMAGIGQGQLSTLVSPTAVVEASRLEVPVVVGAGDGPLANLGAGALRSGAAALSIGTSGAVRIVTSEPTTDAAARLFCAALDEAHWVVGGAISNGGIVLRWLRDQLFAGIAPVGYGQLTALANDVPAGAEGLTMLPYLAAERAPSWDGRRGGLLLGLDLRHGTGHVVRAAMEGVAMQLRLVAEAMADNGCSIERFHASGGFTASQVWVQILADVLQRDIAVPLESEGSSLGAAMLGLVALGLIENLGAAADRVRLGGTVSPIAAHARVYVEAFDRFRTAASATTAVAPFG